MISFALMLMTLPSRMAEVRAGRADRPRQAAPSIGWAVRGGLPDSSREGSGGGSVWGGERLNKSSSAARDNASPARTGRYNKER